MASRYKYTLNHDFFSSSEESPTQFYWAGFLASSANVIRATAGGRAYRLEFNLAAYDKPHLEKMVLDFGGNIPVNEVPIRLKDSIYFQARLVISSKKMVMDLARFGLGMRKKSEYVMPTWLTKHSYIRHFLRGWVDGKGGFIKHNVVENENDDNKIRREFRTSGTIMFLEQLCSILSQNLKLEVDRFPITIEKNNFGKVRYLHQKDVDAIADFLYRDVSVAVDRKLESALGEI